MRDMTTAEFAKANLAALEEPVTIRRYTKTLGTYYPDGYEPLRPDPSPQVTLDSVAPESIKATQKVIEDLTEEVARLKKELAKRPVITTTATPDSGHETIVLRGLVVPAPRRTDDPFAGLAKQDRAFFERKLGTGKKKS